MVMPNLRAVAARAYRCGRNFSSSPPNGFKTQILALQSQVKSINGEIGFLRSSLQRLESRQNREMERKLKRVETHSFKFKTETEKSVALVKTEAEKIEAEKIVLKLPKLKVGYSFHDLASAGVANLILNSSVSSRGIRYRFDDKIMRFAKGLDRLSSKVASVVSQDVEETSYTKIEAVVRVSDFLSKWVLIVGLPLIATWLVKLPLFREIVEFIMENF